MLTLRSAVAPSAPCAARAVTVWLWLRVVERLTQSHVRAAATIDGAAKATFK